MDGARIDHIAIAVESMDAALATFRDLWATSPAHPIEEVGSDGVREAMLPVGDTYLQLLEASTPESTVARFIERRGEGLHHIAVEVDDVAAELARLRDAGARLIDEAPRRGGGGRLVAFVHPKSAAGVLIELVQRGT